MKTNFTYSLLYKLPRQIVWFVMLVLSPVILLSLLLFGLFSGDDITGELVAVFIILPIFFVVGISNITLLPNVEIWGDKFRILTPISKSDWIDIENILNVKRYLTKRQSQLIIVEVNSLPALFSLNALIYGSKTSTCFFIHRKIRNYETLLSVLSSDS